MQIKSAKFVISNQNVANCPKTNIPEYAFIGRSNVGKSSLINMLTNQKNLAKTSSRPRKETWDDHDRSGRYTWTNKLNDDERYFIKHILAFFARKHYYKNDI